MKTRLTFLIAALSGTLATTSLPGQTIYTFASTNGADIGLAGSWTPAGQPSGATQDTAQWDGVVAGNLLLNYNTGWPSTGFGTSGINYVCTVNQVANVQITTTGAASPAVGINGITNNSPSGVLRIGESGTAHQLNLATRPGNQGAIHGFVNNSSSAAIMDSSVTWVAGGGVSCVMDFGGTGDWTVNHNLRDNNSGAGPIWVTWEGPGTMSWSPGGTWLASDNLGPITINGGTMILKGAGLAQFSPPGFQVLAGNNTITNLGTLKYDAVAISDTIARIISGNGTLQVTNGTLTLSGANTYTGPTVLSGGKLIVNGVENAGTSGPLGVGGSILFNGGTLGYGVLSTFDYSPRFNTLDGQQYKFDTGGHLVSFATPLTSFGGTLTQAGAGTLTLLSSSTYTGPTTVGAGLLVFQGSKSGSGSITIADGAGLGVTATGSPVTPGTLAVGTSSGATLEFNNVNNTTNAPLVAGTLASAGTATINVNGGKFFAGQSYPLFTWASGPAPAVGLGILSGALGSLSTNGNKIQLNVNQVALSWTGTNNANWDSTTPNNWQVNGSVMTYADPLPVLFDDTAPGTPNVTLNAAVQPKNVTFNNNTLTYSITSSSGKDIAGTAALIKGGSGVLTLSGGFNAYTGITTLRGGTVSVGTLANGASPSDIGASGSSATNLVLNGGTLQYTGGAASSDRLFTVGTAGGTVDASGTGALNLNNTGLVGLSGVGLRQLTLTGTDADANTLAAALGDAPAGGAVSLTKAGAGTWVLTGTNNYSGGTTISGGTLQVGAGGTSGSVGSGDIIDNATLDLNRSGTLTVSGVISGTGSLINDGGGTVVLSANNTYGGGTTINGGTLQVGNGGGTGQLNASANIGNSGTIVFNSSGDLTLSGVISGTGQLIKRGGGLLKFIGNNTYTGGTTVDAGAQLQLTQGNTGANASPAITNNGNVIMMRQDNGVFTYAGNISGTGKVTEGVSNGNGGDSTLTGTNTYTGGTYILGGGIVLGDNGVTPYGGSIIGNVFLTNDTIHATFGPNVPAIISFNRAEDVILPGNIVGDGQLTQRGSAILTLTGTNTYTGITTITAGTLQVGTNGTSGSIGTGNVSDNSLLVFNRADNLTYGGVISGGGSLVQQGTGTLTLSGANSYFGATTLSNGTVVVASADTGASGPLGSSGPISLYGGTLAFSVNNAFDYSSRFDTASGQMYNFDTAGQNVTFATGLGSVGGALTKAGAGTLTLAGASTYDGPTTVNAGLLVFQGTKSGSANITVADGAGLGVTTTGTQITPGALTLGTSAGTTLEFNNVSSTTTAPLAAGTLSSAGLVTVNINGGTFAAGQSYPLLAWTTGSAPAVSLGILYGALGNLSTNGNTIRLNVSQVALAWTGLSNGNWDMSAVNNWQVSGGPTIYADPLPVDFDDTATGTTTVIVNAVVQPRSVAVNNSSLTYSISSSAGKFIGGTAALIKNGTNTLTLSGGFNTNTGGMTVRGGTVSVGALANGGSASDIGAASSSATNLVLNGGGTLQYTGGAASIDRLFTLGTGGGTLDASGAGALNLNNPGAVGQSGEAARGLTLTGANLDTNTLSGAVGNLVGATAVSKTGPGKWVLAGTNAYSGGTTISAGTLQVGAGSTNGSTGSGNITNNSSLVFNRTGTLSVGGTVSGTGSITNIGGGTVILPGDNTYTGGTTVSAGTLQIGNAGATGRLDANSVIVDNGILIFNSSSTNAFTLSSGSTISGTGQLIKRGSNLLKLLGTETYTGTTTIDAGAQLQIGEGTQGSFAGPAIADNGTLTFVRSDNGVFTINGNISGSGIVVKDVSTTNASDVTLIGTNTYSGGTLIKGGGIILGDGVSVAKGSVGTGNVVFTNSGVTDTFRSLTFNRPDSVTFGGAISSATSLPALTNSGAVVQNGTGTVTLTASNNYGAGTIINAGRLQIGAGGTSGSINGNVTNNGVLVFNRSDNVTFGGLISGSGAVVKTGSGTLTFPNANTYTGPTTVSNGMLIINGNNAAVSTTVYGTNGALGGTGTLAGAVTLNAGTTLAPGASVGTLTINNNLSIGGNLAIEVNKSLAQSNDLVVVTGVLANTGTGILTVKNLGPNIAPGDKFTLFSKPMVNGTALSITGARANWTNTLALDGSIRVLSIAPPPVLNSTRIGNSLQFSWSDSYSTFKLQAQTNGTLVGLGTNWADYPGGSISPITVPILPVNNTFYRLKLVSTP